MIKTSPRQRSNQAPCTCQYTHRGCFHSRLFQGSNLPENRLFCAFLVSQLVLPVCNRGAVWVSHPHPHILQTTFQFDKFVRKLSTIIKAPGGSLENGGIALSPKLGSICGGWGFPWRCCSWDNWSRWCWKLFYSCCCCKAHLYRGPSSTASPSSTSKST